VSGYNDSSGGIMIYTMPVTATDVDERFDDETYRATPNLGWATAPACPPVGADKFSSLLPLDNSGRIGAQVYGGDLIYPVENFLSPANRRPIQQAGTDYSIMAGVRTYQRPFRHDTTPASRSNIILYLPGFNVTTIGGVTPDIAAGGTGSINLYLYIPGVTTVWLDCGKEYFSSLFPVPENGCLVKSLSGTAGGLPTNEYFYCTFGTLSTTLGDRMVMVRAEYRSVPSKRFSRILAYNWT
jgi:hypothetical protein